MRKMKIFIEKYLRYAVLALAATAMVFGILRGEALTVLGKAAAICLECIGIG